MMFLNRSPGVRSENTLDLTGYVPKEILPLANPQTDLPRIAKDARLIGLIEEAVQRIPTFHNILLGDARRMEILGPESVPTGRQCREEG
jgi:hypothetical protein